MEIWSKCDICGRDIPVGELCYGLKKGNCICKDCCTGFENCTFTLAPAPTLTQPNEPLTLEQLRGMDGEPVYDYLGQEWYVIQEYYDHELTMTDGTRFFDDDEIDGVDKRFYRRPPEGEEDT